MDKKKTGNLIREARIGKNYTQSELGDLLGVTNKAVSRWENGDSFPDIGILENLSEILDIKIQDIVTGEIQSNDESAITEVVRLAKLQEKMKQKKMSYFLMGVTMLLYTLGIGYVGLIGSGIADNTFGVICIVSLAIILMILIHGGRFKKECLVAQNKTSKYMCVVSIVLYVWIILMICSSIIMISNGVVPYSMDLSAIGPFLNNRLIVVFLLNFIMLIVEFFRICKENANIHSGILISISTIYLVSLYGDMLHHMSTVEGIYKMLFSRSVIVIVELVIAIIVSMLLKRRIEK